MDSYELGEVAYRLGALSQGHFDYFRRLEYEAEVKRKATAGGQGLPGNIQTSSLIKIRASQPVFGPVKVVGPLAADEQGWCQFPEAGIL